MVRALGQPLQGPSSRSATGVTSGGDHDDGQFERVVDEVVDSLPDWVLDRIDNLSVVVAEHPTREQDPDGIGLLGLYEGVSLLERGNDYFGAMPEMITVFRPFPPRPAAYR